MAAKTKVSERSVATDDRLAPVSEGMQIVGVASRTTYLKLVKNGELPPLIKRGARSFHLLSDLMRYLDQLAAKRAEQRDTQAEATHQAMALARAGKDQKRAEHAKRLSVGEQS